MPTRRATSPGARQQAFVQALEKKIVRPSNIFKLPEIGKRFMNGVATDLTTNQILELAYLKWRVDGRQQAGHEGRPAGTATGRGLPPRRELQAAS